MTLHNAQDAIKQAIEGGWNTKRSEHPMVTWFDDKHLCLSEMFTDPLFWQALGKARGWGKRIEVVGVGTMIGYHGYAHKWFETRMSNGDETNFWQSLP
jgi:hypothetical protein